MNLNHISAISSQSIFFFQIYKQHFYKLLIFYDQIMFLKLPLSFQTKNCFFIVTATAPHMAQLSIWLKSLYILSISSLVKKEYDLF